MVETKWWKQKSGNGKLEADKRKRKIGNGKLETEYWKQNSGK